MVAELLLHGDDVIQTNLERPGIGGEADELRAIGRVDVLDAPALLLRHPLEIELQLHNVPVHCGSFELVVVITRDRLVTFFRHAFPSEEGCDSGSVPGWALGVRRQAFGSCRSGDTFSQDRELPNAYRLTPSAHSSATIPPGPMSNL